MHDYFDLLGLSHTASANDRRRALRGRARAWHPDFSRGARHGVGHASPSHPRDLNSGDLAIDFADVSLFVERVTADFFRSVP